MIFRRRQPEESWRWDALATYNAEVARGIAHTPEWRAKMAKLQEAFDLTHRPYPRLSGPVPR